MILADRILEGFNAEIHLELDDNKNLRIIVEDSEFHRLRWAKAAEDGKEALQIFYHPFLFGLELSDLT